MLKEESVESRNHKLISRVILLFSAEPRRAIISHWRSMVSRFEDEACLMKSVCRFIDRLDMTLKVLTGPLNSKSNRQIKNDSWQDAGLALRKRITLDKVHFLNQKVLIVCLFFQENVCFSTHMYKGGKRRLWLNCEYSSWSEYSLGA